ncbi:MAG: hypothetical protein RSC06_13390 [Clostridia bacterium]
MIDIDAYCDTCFTPCSEGVAKAQKPCRRCGNTHFFIVDREHPMPSGSLAYRSTRERNLDAFLDALIFMSQMKVSEMTKLDFERFVAAGEVCLSVYDKAQDESKKQDRRTGIKFELPPVVEFPIRLPDMYMRFGYWDDAKRVYSECAKSRYLRFYKMDFDQLILDADENRDCVSEITRIVESGEHSQKAIKKQLGCFSPRAVNWSLRFYKGIVREKNGSDYTVSLRLFQRPLPIASSTTTT